MSSAFSFFHDKTRDKDKRRFDLAEIIFKVVKIILKFVK